MLAPILNASGAIPVYRREEHAGEVDNRDAYDRLYEVLEAGQCVGIFPEGISHVGSQLVKLKTGTARAALSLAARGKATAPIVPCGLNYIHRHRFRSQVFIEFGEPIVIDAYWVARFRHDEQKTVQELTDRLAETLRNLTLNAPDWSTLRFIQAARRLYKPSAARLTPGQYVELNRRFVTAYLQNRDDPELQSMTQAVEEYQARLDALDLRDHQLRQPVRIGQLSRRILLRAVTMLLLLPLALPGALLHLPFGWAAATAGDYFSYERDDVATLKVFSTILLLPPLYLIVAITVGVHFGFVWGLAVLIVLPFSFFASVRLIETEAGLLMSIAAALRLARLRRELDELRATRGKLVTWIRDYVERQADPDTQRIFTRKDFAD
jgi:glycerol-3-phosphate O-acyltransferase/dihydroxyacetone phosphate acyltransferase